MVRSTWIGICSNARTPPQSIFTALHSKENGSGVWRDNEAASALSRSRGPRSWATTRKPCASLIATIITATLTTYYWLIKLVGMEGASHGQKSLGRQRF